MTTTCNSCGAEIPPDATTCWNCNATGDAVRGTAKVRGSKAPLFIALAVIALGAAGGGVWWGVLREGAPYASLLKPATPASAPAPTADASAPPKRMKLPDWVRSALPRPRGSATPPATAASTRDIPAASEAILIADPVDGPFFVTFKQLLPADYATMIAPLLAQIPDPQKEHDRFDELLSNQLEAFQAGNARAIVAAETPVLAEMAANLQRAMRAPEICFAAMQGAYQPLPLANIEARKIAAASNVSLIRAVASGRTAGIARVAPSPTQVQAFNSDLQKRLTAQQWSSFQAGKLEDLPVSDQCIVMAAYWSVIAGYPPEEAAQWTAYQMSGLIRQ